MTTTDTSPDTGTAGTADITFGFLQHIAEDYYRSIGRYHRAPKPDSAQRVYWRIRLIVLAQLGDELAHRLETPSPDWQGMHELITSEDTP